jgi:deoxyribonuclease V
MIACVDVDYRGDSAVAAGVWFRGWNASAAERLEWCLRRDPAPYEPGAFYKRELPNLLAVLAKGLPANVVVIDGYVTLAEGMPGLGAHLHDALDRHAIVVGVAKTRYAGATHAVAVERGKSKSPLYVTAAGASDAEAAAWIAQMHGPHRIPTMLKLVDRLARDSGRS